MIAEHANSSFGYVLGLGTDNCFGMFPLLGGGEQNESCFRGP